MRACERIEINCLGLRALRHLFASEARRAGAPCEWLERVTHNARAGRDALDGYLHPEWSNLCDVVERAGRNLTQVLK
jgi:hypothetical protein